VHQLISQITQYLDSWLSDLEVEEGEGRAPVPHSRRRHCRCMLVALHATVTEALVRAADQHAATSDLVILLALFVIPVSENGYYCTGDTTTAQYCSQHHEYTVDSAISGNIISAAPTAAVLLSE